MKAKILLAEDDTALSFVIKDSLTDAGYEVFTCNDGEAAWQEFQKKKFDLCLLDVNMPIRDGFSLAKKIRQQSDVVPVIFITAKSMEEDKLKGLREKQFSTSAGTGFMEDGELYFRTPRGKRMGAKNSSSKIPATESLVIFKILMVIDLKDIFTT